MLAFSKAFHGRTSGAVAATDNPSIRSPFNGTPNVEFTPLNDLEAARAKLATREFAAVIIEGIQGVSGIHCPTDEFLRGLRAAATETGTQLVLDEIQSGYGRTGRFFAHQWAGIRPDLITMAKGMGNGFPIGGVLIAPHFEARPDCSAPPSAAATSPALRPSPCWMSWSARSWSRTPPTRANTCSANCVRPTDRKNPRPRPDDRHRDRRFGRGIPQKLLFGKHVFTGGAGASTVRLLPALCLTRELADRFLDAFDATLRGK